MNGIRQERSLTVTVKCRMVSFSPAVEWRTVALAPWKGCCAGYWKRGEAWCQGDLWKCRRKPADSAAIVPCLEASPKGYTDVLCGSDLPSLSRLLLRACGCFQHSTLGFLVDCGCQLTLHILLQRFEGTFDHLVNCTFIYIYMHLGYCCFIYLSSETLITPFQATISVFLLHWKLELLQNSLK